MGNSRSTSERAALLRYFRECRPYWRPAAAIAACMAALALLQLPGPIVTMRLIDRATSGGLTPRAAATLCIALIVLLGAGAAIRAVQGYALERFRFKLLLRFQSRLFSHALHLPLDAHGRYTHGYLLSRINDDPQQLQSLFAGSLLSMFADLFTLCVGLSFLFHLHARLALLAITALPVMLYLFICVRTRLKNDYSRLQESTAIVTRTLTDGLSNIISSKSFLLEKLLQRRYFHDMSAMWRGRFKVWRRRYSYEAVLSAITGVVPIAVLWYGTQEVASHHLTVGQLVAFMSFLGYLYRPAEGMVISLLAMQNSMVAADRIFEILDLQQERQLRAIRNSGVSAVLCAHPGSIAPVVPNIAITDVAIGYPGSPQCVLSHVNLEIFPDEVVQITGPSGSGKSTLAKLLTGLLQPCKGNLYIQGKEQFSIPLEQLRRLVLLVTHESGILSASVLTNIMCGAKDATIDDAMEAARLVHAHEFISRLPQGYDTKISKDGAAFSSGQIQRIILARALLRRPAVLVLDEAMSFLDQATASEIMANIRLATAGKTLINICHRGYGIRLSDRRIVVKDGGVFQPDYRDCVCDPLSRSAFDGTSVLS